MAESSLTKSMSSKPQDERQDSSVVQDAVFGEIIENGPNYRDMINTTGLMMKTQFGLGMLSIAGVFDTLGLIPGVLCLCVIATIITWSNYVIGQFKLRHPEVYGIDDAGGLMFGRLGQEVLDVAVCIYWIFCSGSGMLSTSIGLNAVSAHSACTSVFVAVAALAAFGLASIRTLGKIQGMAWVGVCSMFVAVIVTVAVGLQSRPASAPPSGDWASDYRLFKKPFLTEAIFAISTIVFAYAGTPGFFPIAAEMRDASMYSRSLFICPGTITAIYIATVCVVYRYCGSYVASPALGSAGALIKKVSYGIALPGLLVSTIIVLHFASKYLFVRILRGSAHLTDNSLIHWATWLSCTFAVTVAAYLIASGIPIFSSLVSLIGALFGTFMSFQPMGCMWLYDNWKGVTERRTVPLMLMAAWSVFVVISGTLLVVAGTYGSIVGIIEASKDTSNASPWSCRDNSI